jgi:hypothetical protein
MEANGGFGSDLRRLVVVRRAAGIGATFPFMLAWSKVSSPPD